MTIVFKVSDNVIEKMIKYYEDLRREKTPPYAIFQAQEADTIITLYESKKAMFQGVSADVDANIWIEMEKKLNNRIIDIKTGKEKESVNENIDFYKLSTIGSDEVGTGDYFGPIVVASTYVDKNMIDYLKELNIDDSKKMTDEYILQVAPTLMEKIPYSAFILTNEKYNELNHEKINMNKIKAILHNKVLLNLKNKNYKYDRIVVDQFTPESYYYNYLRDVPNKVYNITFVTKAESKCLSVACASVISRYIFLTEMEKISQKINRDVPKGSGENVDIFAKELVDDLGFDILKNIAKLNFKNTDKLKS